MQNHMTRTDVLTIRLAFITVGGLAAGVVTAIAIVIYDAFDAILSNGVADIGLADYADQLIPFVVAVNLICMVVAFMIYRRVMRNLTSE